VERPGTLKLIFCLYSIRLEEEKPLNRNETYLLPVSIRNIWCNFGLTDVAGREQVQEQLLFFEASPFGYGTLTCQRAYS